MEEKRNVPNLRFPGFTDSWEQRRLGEIGSVAMCKRVYKNQTTEAGDVPFFKIGTFGGEPDAFISNELFEKYRELYSFPKVGDILISAAGTIGRTIVYQGERAYYQDSNIVWLNHDERLDNSFFLQYLNNQTWSSLEGSTLKRLYNKDILDANIALPKPDEQHRIGALFRKLDSLIALHQRKLDHVKELKKGLLQKMFPKEGANVPELRFPGFTDPWEQRRLGEVAHRVTRKNEEGMSDLPLTISAQHGLVDQRDFFNSQVASRDMRGYYLLERGEFAYNKSTSSDSPWGAIKRLTEYEKGCLSTLYICFGLDEGDPDFLVTYYETSRWHRGIRMIAAEGARNHGLLNIAPGDFFETELTLPGKIEEQTAIGALFAKLDSLIALHQRELDHVKELKKGLLQQMFV